MAIFKKSDQLKKWRYKVEAFNLIIPGEKTIKIPTERFRGLEITKLYEELVFPIIKITVNLSADQYYKILKNKNKCSFYIKINRYYINVTKNGEKSIKHSYINDVFTLIMDEQTEDMLRSLKELENKKDYTKKIKDTENSLEMVDNVIEFYIYKKSIDNLKTVVNKVITNCNVSDAIAYLFTVAGYNNVIMAQPNNTRIYDEFILPPLSILKNIIFIDSYYGLYSNGTIIYFDTDYTYIVPYDGKCHAYMRNDNKVTNIIIPKSTNTTFCNSLCNLKRRGDTTNAYIIADYHTVNIENESISNNYINGNNTTTIDSYSGSSSSGGAGAISKSGNFTKVIENRTENPFLAHSLSIQAAAKSVVITLRMNDFDESDLSPNKKLNIIFEDSNYTKKYNGNYLLSSAVHSFIPDGEDLALTTVAVFKKL